MSKISIVVPIYNAGKKLEKCIKSILNQTFKDFEIVLVNDGSTDNSLRICKKYQEKDSRIAVINKKNEGSIIARRTGIEIANCEYIMFIDADDWIDKNTLEILYNESIFTNSDITVCNMYKTLGSIPLIKKKNNSEYFMKDRIYSKKEIKENLIVAYFHGHPFPSSLCAKLYKKEVLINCGNYLDKISFLGDDLFYNLEILLKVNRVKIINKPLYYYRFGGFTSKYMSYLFEDMVNGYQIQKKVIDEYYQDSLNKHYNGISIMLLNTFKTCLHNLFNGKFNESKIKELIRYFVLFKYVRECLDNQGSIKYFPSEYLNAIRNKDIEYLYQLGRKMYISKKAKNTIFNIIANVI